MAGGYAVALHGAVRGTVDVDIVIRLRKADFASAEAALKGIGLAPRLPVTAEEVFEFREEYIARRNLIAMKRRSGRAQDLEDVRALESLRKVKR